MEISVHTKKPVPLNSSTNSEGYALNNEGKNTNRETNESLKLCIPNFLKIKIHVRQTNKKKKTNLKRKKEVGLVFVMSCCHKHDMCAYKKNMRKREFKRGGKNTQKTKVIQLI